MEFAKFRVTLYYIVSPLLFLLLYCEDRVFISSVSLSNLWRILFLSVLTILFLAKLKKRMHKDLWLLLSLPFSLIFISGLPGFNHIEEIAVAFIIPLVAISVASSSMIDNQKSKLLLYLSSFLIITTVPYLLNILQPVELEINELLGKFSDQYGMKNNMLVGMFKHPSYAGKTLALCTVITWFHFRSNKKLVLLLISLLGAYGAFMSFTRTSWVLLIIGVVLIEWKRKNYKGIFFSFLALAMFLANSVDSFIVNRILGVRDVYIKVSFIDTITNGRFTLFENALLFFSELSFWECLVGVGKDYADQHTGVAHNRFLEVLLYGGVKSLLILLFILRALWKRTRLSAHNLSGLLGIILLLYVVSLIPSHGFPFWGDVLFGILLGIVYGKDTYFQKAV